MHSLIEVEERLSSPPKPAQKVKEKFVDANEKARLASFFFSFKTGFLYPGGWKLVLSVIRLQVRFLIHVTSPL